MKEVTTQNLETFEFATQESINVPLWITVGFQQRDRQDSQNLNNDSFYRSPVTSAQCIIGTKKHPVSCISTNYDDDEYSQGYGPIKEAFTALTMNDILRPFIAEHDFRSANKGDNTGYILYVFDIRYQKK